MIGKTNSQGVVPKGTINITANGSYSIGPYSEAIVSVSGLVPSGTLEISSNGVYDVTTYASASVNVQGGEYPYSTIEALLRGSNSYEGYLPSVLSSNAFLNRDDLLNISAWFSSNWSFITLGNHAFENCWRLSYINFLEDKQIYISDYAFANCSELAMSIINPLYSVRSVYYDTPQSPFTGTKKIPLISITNSSYVSLPMRFFGSATVSKIYVSAPIIYISNYLFASCQCSDITLSATSYVYAWSNLAGVLQGNSAVESFSASVRISYNWNIYYDVGGYFASGCSSLKTVSLDITSGVTGTALTIMRIGYAAFSGCTQLETLNLTTQGTPISITSMSAYAFYNASKANIHLSEQCEIASYALWNCGLRSFVNTYKTVYGSSIIGNCTFLAYVKTKAYYFYPYNFISCPSLSYVSFEASSSLNASVYFGSSCFAFCTNLKSVLFSMKATFYSHAFRGCTSLESIYLFSTSIAENTYNNAFYQTPLDNSTYLGYYGSIYVRASLLDTYKATTNWVQYSDRFVGLTDAEIEQIITDYNNVSYVE